ncbi:SRPBCC family protein [Solicola sp. PLA-1-18]|uniref:SRPBCC family protein n=1 Tax=Solicola sp. PLA-1-18 TaxID=3380532 RepID=UPI003B7BDF38
MRWTVAEAGPADPDDAWEKYADPDRWAEWSPQVRSVESSAPRLTAGMTGVVQGPPLVRVPFTVEAVDEAARTWAWRVKVGPFKVRLRHELLASAEGTVATLTLDGPAPFVLPYAQLARVALVRLVA